MSNGNVDVLAIMRAMLDALDKVIEAEQIVFHRGIGKSCGSRWAPRGPGLMTRR